ncbi:hypothetical protein [Streptomyces barkulensis]|uniref:hypothetical protein n=1 Tax=Streptomyces barkulensis TaxID=1257026 RepID=UPI001880EEC6|nr:hypothetical protein [Streptomyces barkulensis]
MGLSTALRNLSERLAAPAARSPRVLLVACPGATAVRLAAEAAVAGLGGRPAGSPAEADVLLVAGEPSEEMRAAVDTVWGQMPEPRVRGEVSRPRDAGAVLRGLLPALTGPGQEAEAARRDDEWGMSGGEDGHGGHGGGGHEGGHEGHGGGHEGGHEGHGEHGGGDGGGHGDHGGMRMPGGLMMADRAEDRDGLKLDVLHVPLGPVLPGWPAGLVVDTVLQGDVVQRAGGRALPFAGPGGPPFWQADGDHPVPPGARTAACHLDSLGRLLTLAEWEDAAAGARRLRDRLLAGEPAEAVRTDFGPWRRRVERSRTLRWATDGIGVLTPADAVRLGVSGPAVRSRPPHDATARWLRWLAETDEALAGGQAPGGGPRGHRAPDGSPPSRGLLDAAVELMPGLELFTARLLVASLDPDPDELAGPEHGSEHGEDEARGEGTEEGSHRDHHGSGGHGSGEHGHDGHGHDGHGSGGGGER